MRISISKAATLIGALLLLVIAAHYIVVPEDLTGLNFVGCQFPHLTVSINDNAGTVCFDFSSKQYLPWPDENPYQFNELAIWQMNRSGEDESLMWKIRARPGENSYLKKIFYGKVPPGWTQLSPARPLLPGEIYSMNDGVIFARNNKGFIVLPGHFYGASSELRTALKRFDITAPK